MAFLAAGRFGLAPSVRKSATAGLQLVEDPNAAGQKTGDPAGKRYPDTEASAKAPLWLPDLS